MLELVAQPPMTRNGTDSFTANDASSSLVETPNLSKMLPRWCFTVSSAILKYSRSPYLNIPPLLLTQSPTRAGQPKFLCRASSLDDCISLRKILHQV